MTRETLDSELRIAHAYQCCASELIKKRNTIRRTNPHDLSGMLKHGRLRYR